MSERSRVSGVRLTPREVREINKLVGAGFFISPSEFIRLAVREKLEAIEVIQLRKISRTRAKKEIIEYLKKKGRPVYASDVERDLGIDFYIVMSIFKELEREGRAEF